MPYLINLKKNFTQHALSDIAELNSKYSIILVPLVIHELQPIRALQRQRRTESGASGSLPQSLNFNGRITNNDRYSQ